ncbi:MAG: InlB B-repeat-containing protein [Erysipelotrichaceae bacterium]
MKKINKIVATLLCSLLVFTSFNFNIFAEETTDELTIYSGSSIVTEIELPRNEKVVLQTGYDETASYQWQMSTDSSKTIWVNIYDQTNCSINLSYAMVCNLLDSTATTYLRVVKNGEASEPVKVTVTYPDNQNGESENIATASTFSLFATPYRLTTLSETEAEDEQEYVSHTIVVNYVYEDGSTAYDSYGASIEENGSFSTTITFPTIVGYLPYVDEIQQNELKIDIEALTEDVVYTVVYKPTLVNYKVYHYQQDALDDNYTLFLEEEKEGLTNAIVTDCEKEFDGFTALIYETVKIAADGSTEISVYYDRQYYLLNFDLDGGYGVEPIYARYETPINDVGTPKKAGYIFSGWSLDGEEATIPDKIPAENRLYKAIWQTNSTAKVTIVFWGENANDEEYSYINSSSIYVKPGIEFTFAPDGSLACGLEEHTHQESCYELICTKEEHTHIDECYGCGETEHTTHTTDCYEGVGQKSYVGYGAPSNPENGYIAREAISWDGKVIYINGTWYKYTGTTSTGNIAPTVCGGIHTHTDECLVCGKEEHTHSAYNAVDGCYQLVCTELAHEHTSDCYLNTTSELNDDDLWTFVQSDTVVVEADGSTVVNVYYDRTEKTLTFKYNYSNRAYGTTKTITAKWGSDISQEYIAIAEDAGSTFWSLTGSEGPYTNYFGVMPQVSATYYNQGKTGSEGAMTYWAQDLNSEYTVQLFVVTGVGGYTVTVEDRYEFEGFTYDHGTEIGKSCSGAAFYYTRNSYKLTFNDGYDDVKEESALYQASLESYSEFVPEVPEAYEPGSVEFGGWYLNPECTGAQYILEEHTMPAENLLLYAKWVPVTHTVNFYLDQTAYQNGTLLYEPYEVVHNKYITVVQIPDNGKYAFIGWFYMDNGTEKAFDFSSMPITKDMDVYGKWSSNVKVEYTVTYVYIDDAGNVIKIADDTTSSALAGTSKTFEAKTGSQLYEGYQSGYYPKTGSHTIMMDIDGNNEYQFVYVACKAVPYTVMYLDKLTGEELRATKIVEDNTNAVVTEVFLPVTGYMPDAYQKRLVLSATDNPADNLIVFYYTKDSENAYYAITHWVQNLEGDGYTEYRTIQSPGKIGTTITEDPLTITGYTYNETKSTASGEITENGLVLNLYYDRNTYPLTVKYLEYGTNKELADELVSSVEYRYGKQVSATAISIKGYKLVGEETKVKTITDGENVIIFYYIEEEVTIKYVAVEQSYGTVSVSQEIVKAISASAEGSVPTAKSRYRFVGWYLDEQCTIPVNSSWVGSDNKLTPQKVDGVNVAATYYAKFVENLGDLTIQKQGWQTIDENQTFLFRVKGLDEGVNDHVDMVVTVHGNGSVTIKDLYVGNYSVTELTDWSFRYSPDSVTKQVNVSTTGLVLTFNNSRSLIWWLDGSNYKVNLFNQGN